MQLLLILSLAGTLSGLIGGIYFHGADGLFLGSSSGFVLGVVTWMVIGTVSGVLREIRLESYFNQEGQELL